MQKLDDGVTAAGHGGGDYAHPGYLVLHFRKVNVGTRLSSILKGEMSATLGYACATSKD